jgi:diketogulonate reductase-like aldo/keto reductase
VERTLSVQGASVPSFMYGTAWKEERTEELVRLAVRVGFRAIDTANQRRHYLETAVGDAMQALIAEGVLRREQLFLQTKFTYLRGQDHRLPYDPHADFTTQVEQSFASSLEHLKTPYVDSYVLHGPYGAVRWGREDAECWAVMERLQRAKQARAIGVSNVTLEHLRELVERAEVAPAFVQNRCFARTGWDREVRALCRERGIVYQGFSLLTANDRELHAPEVRRIAERHGRTVPEVVFRFALAVGMLPLTGTTNEAHMRQALAAFDFELQPDEVAVIERLGQP